MKTINYIISFLIVGILISITGCSEDEDKLMPPTSEDAIFNLSYDPENPNKVYFLAEPAVPTWYTHWSFGDNTSFDEGLETSKVYLKKGEYDVDFKIFTDGGTALSTQTVVIDADFAGPNIIRNGDFNDGNEFWTILPISDGVDVSLDNNNAQWTGGNWGQEGIYQEVHVLGNNTYQITMDIKGSGLSDSWFEVYIGTEPPVAGQDYVDGGIRMALNTWDGCGSEPFDGPFSDYSCVGSGATFEFPTEGTVYFVIRGGGASYGDMGVTVDNIAIRSLESTDPPIFPAPGAPTADFTSEISDLAVTFTNTSINATSYTWDFGDSTGTSTDVNPSYTYAQDGTYTVQLTASNGSESSVITKDVTVAEATASTSLQNGEFSDTSAWTIITQNASGNGKLTIADGVAVFDEAIDVASGSWGSEAHMGMYQGVIVEAGEYQFDMDITTNGIDEAWLEVWIGTSKPVDGVEYNADSGATKVLSFNAWDCGDTNKTYSGKMAAASCQDTDGTINLEANTYYILIRSGGFTFGDGGIIIDNVTMEDKVAGTLPVADFTVEISDLTATFTNASTDATSYVWDFGDGTGTSSEESPIYTYTQAGTYNVQLTANGDGAPSIISKEVIVVSTAPMADFTVETVQLTATFTNSSTNATSYVWDFGDGTGTSTDENPSYTYAVAGTYNVKLTATNDQGSDEFLKEITVIETSAANLITNGSFDDESGWTIINHYEATNLNGSVTIADGVVKFDETTSADWKHMGIYTAVELTAGTYQFEMDMTYTDISDIWGEVYIGATQPAEGSDYNGDKKVLKAYNAWDCGDIKTYAGKATESGCDDANPTNPGQFEITEAGTYFLLFRTGGATYGTTGIVIDNISLVKTN